MKALIYLFLVTTSLFANEGISQIQKLIAEVGNPVVVFDLDDTLFYSSSRSWVIFKELANSTRFKEEYPKQIAKLGKIELSQIKYSIEDTLRDVGIVDPALIKKILKFWKERFFTNEYVKEDAPVEGGREYVHKLRSLGARIVYLTGRDHSMREGTIESLKSSGFPFDEENSILITKERFDIPDIDYKKGAFEKIANMGTVVAFFENEPKNLNAMIERFKKAVPVFLDIKHSPSPIRPYEKAIWIKDYIFATKKFECAYVDAFYENIDNNPYLGVGLNVC